MKKEEIGEPYPYRHMNFADLSIVLQGPAELDGRPTAALAAQSARNAFFDAEIIVSCWDGDRTEPIVSFADRVVTSPDPGPQRFAEGVLNVNRQIVSSRAGLDVATKPFVLKARTDLLFRDARIWNEYLERRKSFRRLNSRDPILITNLTTVNPQLQPRYFALCDWIYLGPRQSVNELLSTPPFPDEYLQYRVNGNPVLRYNAEQWIAINYLALHGLDLETIHDGFVADSSTAKAYRELVGRHFTMSSWFRLGLATQKHRISSFSLNNMYTHREWTQEFLNRHSRFDLERFAVTIAYHPVIRAAAKSILRTRRV